VTETAGQFFERAQHRGRAVLVGTDEVPYVWLARSILTAPDLSVQFEWIDEMRWVPRRADIEVVKQTARRMANHIAMKTPKAGKDGSRRNAAISVGEHIERTETMIGYMESVLADSTVYQTRYNLKKKLAILQARLKKLKAK